MGVEHGWLLFILGMVVSVAVMYIILTVMSNEGLDDTDSDDSI